MHPTVNVLTISCIGSFFLCRSTLRISKLSTRLVSTNQLLDGNDEE